MYTSTRIRKPLTILCSLQNSCTFSTALEHSDFCSGYELSALLEQLFLIFQHFLYNYWIPVCNKIQSNCFRLINKANIASAKSLNVFQLPFIACKIAKASTISNKIAKASTTFANALEVHNWIFNHTFQNFEHLGLRRFHKPSSNRRKGKRVIV